MMKLNRFKFDRGTVLELLTIAALIYYWELVVVGLVVVSTGAIVRAIVAHCNHR